jgi:hypothetical protein
MQNNTIGIASIGSRSAWVRLRTLIFLRWLAIAGQTLALLDLCQGFWHRLTYGHLSGGDRRIGAC